MDQPRIAFPKNQPTFFSTANDYSFHRKAGWYLRATHLRHEPGKTEWIALRKTNQLFLTANDYSLTVKLQSAVMNVLPGKQRNRKTGWYLRHPAFACPPWRAYPSPIARSNRTASFDRLYTSHPWESGQIGSGQITNPGNSVPTEVPSTTVSANTPRVFSTTTAWHQESAIRFHDWTLDPSIGFDQPDREDTLIYLIHHANRKQADLNWKADFGQDGPRNGKRLSGSHEWKESYWSDHPSDFISKPWISRH